jgi:hypothetical protein
MRVLGPFASPHVVVRQCGGPRPGRCCSASVRPAIRGYCADGVSQGHTVSIDPEAWTIYDGKLYLNYSKGVREKWSKDITKYLDLANKNWPFLHK